MADTYFMTEAEVKAAGTGIDKNIDPSFINFYIIVCQQNYVKQLLGKDYYNELITQKSANTLTAANQEIVTRLKKALAFRVRSEIIFEMTYKTTNQGVVSTNGEDFTVAEKEILIMKMQSYKDLAENFRNNDVREYICDNSSLYPLYGGKIKGNNAFNTGYGIVF